MTSSKAPSEIRIGTSGWSYPHWKERFYPHGLPSRCWLAYYQTKFDTEELNAGFYRQPSDQRLADWRESSPGGFLWSLKANRNITHFQPLRRRESLDRFLRGAKKLGDTLGVVLLQLPPNLKFEARTVERFLAWLPDEMRFAIEPRHPSWFEPESFGSWKGAR